MSVPSNDRSSERGSIGIKLVVALVLSIVIANAGVNYVPVAYQGMSLRQEIDAAVVQGTAVPMIKKTPLEAVRHHLDRVAKAAGIPVNSVIEAKQVGNTVQGRVSYSVDVDILPFGLYTYTYNFDYVAIPNGYLAKN